MLCPLCQKECYLAKEVSANLPPTTECPSVIPHLAARGGYGRSPSHFIRYSTGGWTTGQYYVERATILPYRLENHLLDGNYVIRTDLKDRQERIDYKSYSVISKMEEDGYFDIDNQYVDTYRFVSILKLPTTIHMDIEEKLLERIKLILLLS